MLIAIDGGGTKTDFALLETNGTILKRVLSGGCNLTDCGLRRTREVLQAGLEQLLGGHGGLQAKLDAAFAGISGGTVGDNKRIMNALLQELLPHSAVTVSDSDAVNALSSGIEQGDGCVVISGTGTSGFVRINKAVSRVGGWGYLFDKGGSGYDFGRDAVYHVLCAVDGRGRATLLTKLVSEALGAPAQDAITVLYQKGKPAIAALAPLVFKAEQQGDEVAKAIMQANAQEMAKLMNTMSSRMRDKPCKTVLAGSLFKDFQVLKPYLLPYLTAEHIFIFPELPPLYGSAVEALALTGRQYKSSFKNNFSAALSSV